MAAFSALPLFTDALLADCGHLNDAEFGLYIKILILIWRSPQCRVPNDHVWIARKLSRPVDAISPIIIEFCTSDGNHITQKRLSKEFLYVKKKSSQRSVASKARWNKEKDLSSRNAPTPSPTPSPTPPKNKVDNSLRSLSTSSATKIEFDFDVITFIGISEAVKEKWRKAFPAVNVDQELENATSWLHANPKNKKSNYERFLHNWFQRQQDKARPAATGGGGSAPKSFAQIRAENAKKIIEEGKKKYDVQPE